MCRYDDEYMWLVGAEFREVNDVERACEDCERTVQPGEEIIRFVATDLNLEYYDDDRPWVWVVSDERWWDPGDDWHAIIAVEDNEAISAFRALGFGVDEYRDPRLPAPFEPDHYSCVQCRAADRWLREICSQSTVLVARQDLISHLDDYDAETLGSDFMTLADLASRRWETEAGRVTEAAVAGLAAAAVAHAKGVGLHPD